MLVNSVVSDCWIGSYMLDVFVNIFGHCCSLVVYTFIYLVTMSVLVSNQIDQF